MNTHNISNAEQDVYQDPPFGNTLVVGAGPAGINVAVNISNGWCKGIGLLNRKGLHTEKLEKELKLNDYIITSKAQGDKHLHLCGQTKLSHFYGGCEDIDDIWQTIIMCTPSDSYNDIIDRLNLDSLEEVRNIILISPSIGSNFLINSRLKKLKERIDVISFSTYFAATKLEPGNPSCIVSFTKALKKHIYIASSKENSTVIFDVKKFIENLGIKCTVVQNTIEAESKNITTYVHPPLFINKFSLDQIFSYEKSNRYMYKIYPEGPITQHSIKAMVLLWKEISELIQYFDAKPINLLKFLNDDNYPVHEVTLSREDIENFVELDQIEQEYLLYIRYSAILIDPFSKPDKNGKYFDFSSVSYKQVCRDENGKWIIPRVPFEDYKKLKLIFGLAQKVDIHMPQTMKLIKLFEEKLDEFIRKNGENSFYPEIFKDTTQDDVDGMFEEIEKIMSY
ncbi:opine metallophore biosynthesis dehydrogenase [Wukongibacter sp. M2B1]|uniref:opine metallophore biosynthesis dehydrogenase n=1 Tax=Wukongibacter sp. M2B1 TaxID=3088895 RepID=UPI003D7AA3AA